jgi:hypothetical protein
MLEEKSSGHVTSAYLPVVARDSARWRLGRAGNRLFVRLCEVLGPLRLQISIGPRARAAQYTSDGLSALAGMATRRWQGPAEQDKARRRGGRRTARD